MGLGLGSKGLLAKELIVVANPTPVWNGHVVECLDMMSFVQRIGTFDGTTDHFCSMLFLNKIPSLCQPGTLKIACFDDNQFVPSEKAECQQKRTESTRDSGLEAYDDTGFVLVDDRGLLYNDGTWQPFSPIRLLKSRWLRPHLYEYMQQWLVTHKHRVVCACGRTIFDFGSKGVLSVQRTDKTYTDPIDLLPGTCYGPTQSQERVNASVVDVTFFDTNQHAGPIYGEAEVACFAWALSHRSSANMIHILSGDFDCIGIALSLAHRFASVTLHISIFTAKNVFCARHDPPALDPPLDTRAHRLSLLMIILPGTDFIQKKLVFHRLRLHNINQACLYAWTTTATTEIDEPLLRTVICVAYHYQFLAGSTVPKTLSTDTMRLRLTDKKIDTFPSESDIGKYISQVLFNLHYWNKIDPKIQTS
jgi:hypothetical protein